MHKRAGIASNRKGRYTYLIFLVLFGLMMQGVELRQKASSTEEAVHEQQAIVYRSVRAEGQGPGVRPGMRSRHRPSQHTKVQESLFGHVHNTSACACPKLHRHEEGGPRVAGADASMGMHTYACLQPTPGARQHRNEHCVAGHSTHSQPLVINLPRAWGGATP